MSLAPFRFVLVTEACPARAEVALGPIERLVHAFRDDDLQRDGRLFRDWRVALGLGLQDVADGWGVPVAQLAELERGLRRFPAPADAWAALQQLWCWSCERHGYAALSTPGGRR